MNEKLTLQNSRIWNIIFYVLCILYIHGNRKYLNYFQNNENKA